MNEAGCTKLQFESESQRYALLSKMYASCTKLQFESESQRQGNENTTECLSCTKIQFESESQLVFFDFLITVAVLNYNLKANHNRHTSFCGQLY